MVSSIVVFVVGTLWGWLGETSEKGWEQYWKILIWYYFILGMFVAIWIPIGGFRDVIRLFSLLRSAKINISDDGRVIKSHNIPDSDTVQDARVENAIR